MKNITEEFRFAIPKYAPYAYACANNTPFTVGRTLKCPQPGVAYELFQIYIQAMAVKPKIMWITNQQVGSYENGTWTGALGMILNGTLDTVTVPFQWTDLREQFFDFSYSFYEVKLVYLVKETKRSGLKSIFDIFSPFSLNFWLMYLTTILALLITLLFIHANYKGREEKPHLNNSNIAWNFFRFLVNSHGQGIGQESLSVKIIIFSGGLFALIMMNLYGNILLSEIIYDRRQPPFTTSDDVLKLIEQGKYKLIYDSSGPIFWYHQETTTSNETHYVQLRKALAKNSYSYADNKTHALQKVMEGGYILPAMTDDSIVFRAFNLCKIDIITPTDSPLKRATYIFRKKSPFIQRFNAAIYSTQRLTDRVWELYYGEVAQQKRARYCKQPMTRSPLSLDTYSSVFALILIGFVLATVLFIVEIVRCKWTLRNRKNFDDNLHDKSSSWRLNHKKAVNHAFVRIGIAAVDVASQSPPLVIPIVTILQPDMLLSDVADKSHLCSTV